MPSQSKAAPDGNRCLRIGHPRKYRGGGNLRDLIAFGLRWHRDALARVLIWFLETQAGIYLPVRGISLLRRRLSRAPDAAALSSF